MSPAWSARSAFSPARPSPPHVPASWTGNGCSASSMAAAQSAAAAPTLARAGHAGAQHAGAATALAAQSIGTVLDRGPRHRAAGTWLAAHERPPRGRCA
ncbi:hypothetical protein G6F23_014814 [Rhizopus arrhizus]|nr:hypothetical protein G6F23_014814 [Rhizopus arrhizus]